MKCDERYFKFPLQKIYSAMLLSVSYVNLYETLRGEARQNVCDFKIRNVLVSVNEQPLFCEQTMIINDC